MQLSWLLLPKVYVKLGKHRFDGGLICATSLSKIKIGEIVYVDALVGPVLQLGLNALKDTVYTQLPLPTGK